MFKGLGFRGLGLFFLEFRVWGLGFRVRSCEFGFLGFVRLA